MKKWFLYKLIPLRPDFGRTLTEVERLTMGTHVGYWTDLMKVGRVLVFGPVSDPEGDWGMAVVSASSMADATSLGDMDPAVIAGVGRYELFELPGAITPE